MKIYFLVILENKASKIFYISSNHNIPFTVLINSFFSSQHPSIPDTLLSCPSTLIKISLLNYFFYSLNNDFIRDICKKQFSCDLLIIHLIYSTFNNFRQNMVDTHILFCRRTDRQRFSQFPDFLYQFRQ